MNLEEKIEFLNEYNAWAAERKVSANSITPEIFLTERVKEKAMAALIEIKEIVDTEGILYKDAFHAIKEITDTL